MTSTNKSRFLYLALLFLALVPDVAGKELLLGTSELIELSDAIVVATLQADGEPRQLTRWIVNACIKGEVVEGSTIVIQYPSPSREGLLPFVEPIAGTTCLIFLSRSEEDSAYSAVGNYQGLRAVLPANAKIVAEQMRLLLRWDELTEGEREEWLVNSLGGDPALIRIALSWILSGDKLATSLSRERRTSDRVICSLLRLKRMDNVAVWGSVLCILQMTGRKDLVAYLVDALDDPETKYIAINELEFHRWKPGDPWPLKPFLPRTDPALVEAKVAELKKWWAEVASKDPEYRKFVPSGNNKESEQKEAPVEDNDEKLPEDTSTTENHSHVSDPAEAASTEGSVTGKPAPAEEHTAASGARTASTDVAEIEADTRISIWLVLSVIGVLCVAAGLWAFIKRK